MTIKDVEKLVGITKSNIRYYENEGLISPKRNDTNNYRDYSEQDVEQLERIKVLRVLGVPISDIRELKDEKVTLDHVMANRLKLLEEEEKDLEAIKRVCENLRQCHLPLDSLSASVLEEDEASWGEQLAKVIKEDITKEILSPKQFNKNLTLMLSWGYLLCAIVSFIFGNWMLSYSGDAFNPEDLVGSIGLSQQWAPFAITFDSVFIIPLFLSVVCYVVMYFSANTKVQAVIFHICALNLSPLLAAVYIITTTFIRIDGNFRNSSVNGAHLGAFWLMITAYVIVLFLLTRTWRCFFSKARYVVITAVIYTAVMTLLGGTLSGLWTASFIGFFLFTMFIGLNWFHAYQNSKGRSRYYAITESCRIMNLFGTAFDMKGKTAPPFVQR